MPKTAERDWLGLAREVLAIEQEGLSTVAGQLNGTFVETMRLMACCKGRVVITGIGKSGLVGRKIAATLSSTGTPSFFLHPVEGAHGDMGMIRPDDVVLAISNSGETDELNAILPALKALGAKIVSMTGNIESTMARLSDVVLEVHVPREACPMGLAPTASTTATLAVGDALAVCLMEWNSFEEKDFKKFHPGGALGQRLSQPIDTLMHRGDLPLCSPAATFAEALNVINEGRLGFCAVTDEAGVLLGVLSDGDVRRIVSTGSFASGDAVSSLMTLNPLSVLSGTGSATVLDLMEERQITVLPVVDSNTVVLGLVHLHDLLGKGHVRFA